MSDTRSAGQVAAAERSVCSISRSSAFISAEASMRLARTAPWHAMGGSSFWRADSTAAPYSGSRAARPARAPAHRPQRARRARTHGKLVGPDTAARAQALEHFAIFSAVAMSSACAETRRAPQRLTLPPAGFRFCFSFSITMRSWAACMSTSTDPLVLARM